MNLKIEYLNKKELKPYARNAKVHTHEQVEQIKKSIREFGFNDPIAIWHDNEIVEGHGRLLAALEMDELESVPVIRLDALTDEQRRAYAIAHNKLTMNTDFDFDALALEIESIETLDMTDFGFNEREILELTVDDSPEDLAPAVVAEGQIAEAEQNNEEQPVPAIYPEVASETDKRDLQEYSEKANQLVTKRVIIIYKTDAEEKFMKDFLHIPENEELGVIYLAERIMNA